MFESRKEGSTSMILSHDLDRLMVERREDHFAVPLPIVSVYQYDTVAEEEFEHGDHEVLLIQASPVCQHLLNQL
jgi:hypothetical protein